MRHAALVMLGLVGSVHLALGQDVEDAASIIPLRQAVEDLSSRFPAYAAKGFLARVREVEQRQQAGSITPEEIASLRRTALLANPLLAGNPIIFVTHAQYAADHHNTETIFLTGECNTGKYRGGSSALKVLDVGQGTVRTLVDGGKTGLVRDPDIHFDGRRVLFSLRKDVTDDYHIYEIGTEGGAPKQLTRLAGSADIDPVYLPDGGIAFSATREPKYCGCNQHIMANIYRMEGDGANIHRIGGSTLFEGHSRVMPDGRIIYDRWEYVDRDFGDAQGLWTMNPDGTNHAIYWGNNTASPGGVVQARPVPGTDLVVATLGSCHDRPWGALGIIDRSKGIDATASDRASILMTWPRSALALVGKGGFDTFKQIKPRYQDPYPLDAHYILCVREIAPAEWTGTGPRPETGIYVVDTFGNEVLVHAEGPACFQPMPLAARPRPPSLPVRREYDGRPATVYVSDASIGTHMQGVKPGDVRWLRVVESPEKRHWTTPIWNGQGAQRPAMNWHNFENKRILGTVPVEEDGSALFEVPADTFVFFQALDKDGMMIHSMRSGVTFQAGERASCVGCHESRLSAPVPRHAGRSKASGRAPSRLDGWHGPARLFGYAAEVQPVWDRKCVSCHDFAGAKPVLAGDRDIFFNASYESLHQRWNRPDGYLRTIGAGPAEIQPANSWGARNSRLVDILRRGSSFKGHEHLSLDADDWDRIITWIDINAPYYPTYATAFPDGMVGRNPLDGDEMTKLKELTGIDFTKQASHSANRGPLISFDRPERSPCLNGLDADKATQAVEIIRRGQERLRQRPRGDTVDMVPCATDQRREILYGERRDLERRNREAIANGQRVYDP